MRHTHAQSECMSQESNFDPGTVFGFCPGFDNLVKPMFLLQVTGSISTSLFSRFSTSFLPQSQEKHVKLFKRPPICVNVSELLVSVVPYPVCITMRAGGGMRIDGWQDSR